VQPEQYHEVATSRGFEWLGPYTGRTEDVTWWLCPYGHRWDATYHDVSQSSGCSTCSISKGEKRMIEVCNIWGIRKENEAFFDKCKSKIALRFDLFVPRIGKEHNGFLFEFQGPHHYEPTDYAGKGPEWAQSHYEGTLRRDELKRAFSTAENFRLTEIHYDNFDNIEEIILEAIGDENIGGIYD
jgi:hypothetical protein